MDGRIVRNVKNGWSSSLLFKKRPRASLIVVACWRLWWGAYTSWLLVAVSTPKRRLRSARAYRSLPRTESILVRDSEPASEWNTKYPPSPKNFGVEIPLFITDLYTLFSLSISFFISSITSGL